MRENSRFPSKLDFALVGILAVSSCRTPIESTPSSPEMTPTAAPTTEVTQIPTPTIGPAVMAVRVPEKDRGIHH